MTRRKPARVNAPFPLVGQSAPQAPRPFTISGETKQPAYRSTLIKKLPSFGDVPDIYRAAFARVPSLEGPGAPPEHFVKATTSGVEWIVYFWLWILLEIEGDPHKQTAFFGGQGANGSFTYQVPFFGGRHDPLGAVPDFLVVHPSGAYILRLQGEWQHVFTTQQKQMVDERQKFLLASGPRGFVVIDIYEQYLLAEPNGRRGSAARCIQDAIEGIAWTGPLAGGNPFRMRTRI